MVPGTRKSNRAGEWMFIQNMGMIGCDSSPYSGFQWICYHEDLAFELRFKMIEAKKIGIEPGNIADFMELLLEFNGKLI